MKDDEKSKLEDHWQAMEDEHVEHVPQNPTTPSRWRRFLQWFRRRPRDRRGGARIRDTDDRNGVAPQGRSHSNRHQPNEHTQEQPEVYGWWLGLM
jgi:hypothetical protein